jgi:hypothetical protein
MNHYDPNHAPNPEEWLELEDYERIEFIEEFHLIDQSGGPNQSAHATFHAIVENQIAQNLESVVRAVPRLMSEGLTRHDAIHAIASVLAEHIHDLFSLVVADKNESAAIYNAAVERLTAKSWLKS